MDESKADFEDVAIEMGSSVGSGGNFGGGGSGGGGGSAASVTSITLAADRNLTADHDAHGGSFGRALSIESSRGPSLTEAEYISENIRLARSPHGPQGRTRTGSSIYREAVMPMPIRVPEFEAVRKPDEGEHFVSTKVRVGTSVGTPRPRGIRVRYLRAPSACACAHGSHAHSHSRVHIPACIPA